MRFRRTKWTGHELHGGSTCDNIIYALRVTPNRGGQVENVYLKK